MSLVCGGRGKDHKKDCGDAARGCFLFFFFFLPYTLEQYKHTFNRFYITHAENEASARGVVYTVL